MGKIDVKIRSIIHAPKDHVLVSWDLKQAESWIVAFLADEKNMKHSLMFSDFHRDTACVLFHKTTEDLQALEKSDKVQYKKMRYIGKQQNHAKAYRESAMRAAQIINKHSDEPPYVTVTFEESREYDRLWHEHYNVKPWWAEIEETLDREARTLTTPYGRVRTFFQPWGQDLFKSATAHVPQSTVADHFNGAVQPELGIEGGLLSIHKQFVLRNVFKLINQSHDSCIAEVHKDRVNDVIEPVTKLIKRPLVIKGEQFTIPVDCEVGETWGELKEVKVA